MSKRARFAFVMISFGSLLFGCSKDVNTRWLFYAFHTEVAGYYEGGDESIKKQSINLLEKISKLSDTYADPGSAYNGLYRLNQTNDGVELDSLALELLKGSIDLKGKTDGYFDPFCFDLSNLWKDALHAVTPSVPSEEVISTCLSNMASSGVQIEGNVATRIGNAKLDFGAVAKGFALKELKSLYGELGVKRFSVSAGNSSLLLGESPAEDGLFDVHLKYDDSFVLQAKNTSIAVSSRLEDPIAVDGVDYSHIVNPLTGEAVNTFDCVYLEGDDPFLLDAMSTASVLNDLEWIKEKEKAYGFKALVYDDGKIVYANEGLIFKK